MNRRGAALGMLTTAVRKPRCRNCGGLHSTSTCPWGLDVPVVPCERPPANGLYQGPLEVRTLPRTASGGDYRSWGSNAGRKGREKRWRKG